MNQMYTAAREVRYFFLFFFLFSLHYFFPLALMSCRDPIARDGRSTRPPNWACRPTSSTPRDLALSRRARRGARATSASDGVTGRSEPLPTELGKKKRGDKKGEGGGKSSFCSVGGKNEKNTRENWERGCGGKRDVLERKREDIFICTKSTALKCKDTNERCSDTRRRFFRLWPSS